MSSKTAIRNRKLGMIDNPLRILNGAEGGGGLAAAQPVPGSGDAKDAHQGRIPRRQWS